MGARHFRDFKSDFATLTCSVVADGYSVDNLKKPKLSKKLKDDGTVTTVQIDGDFGEDKTASAVFVGGHDFVEGSDTVTLYLADDAAITSGVVTETLTIDADYDSIVKFFTEVTKRYFRLEYVKPLAADQRSFGRLIVGDGFEWTHGIMPGFAIGYGRDTGRVVTTEGAVAGGDIGVPTRTLRGVLSSFTDDEKKEWELIQKNFGTTVPFVFCVDWDRYPQAKSIYGRLTRMEAPKDIGILQWRSGIAMTEQR